MGREHEHIAPVLPGRKGEINGSTLATPIIGWRNSNQFVSTGMPKDACPELWILEHPDVLQNLQKEYIVNGAQVLYAPTFTANRAMLARFGLQDKVEEINAKLVALTKGAAQGTGVLVAGDIAPTNLSVEPLERRRFWSLSTFTVNRPLPLNMQGWI